MGRAVVDGARHVGVVTGWQRARCDESAAGADGVGEGAGRVLRGGGIEIAPVDAQVVAGFRQQRLLLRAEPEQVAFGEAVAAPDDFLRQVVDCEMRRDIEVELDLMRLAVGGVELDVDDGQGTREQIEVVGQGGRGEGERQYDAGALEAGNGAGGQDIEIDLGQGGDIGVNEAEFAAEEAVGRAVNADEAAERMGRAGPMSGVVGGELVGQRPDAEVGIVNGERHGWRSEVGHGGGLLLSACAV